MSSPHPLKTRSIMCGSLPVFMVPLIKFSDDTSGNRSKVWNKFDSWCFLKTRSIMCGSLPVFMVPLIIFSDDTSGNRSKVWNKFDSWCFLLAGLRQKDSAQFCNIHFICTSNQVPVMEMAHPLVDQLLELERGIVVFDAQLNTNALILICFLCDNPRAAEICSHLGSGTLKFCRICRVSNYNYFCHHDLLLLINRLIILTV